MFYKKGGGDIWSILTLNNVFFLGKMEKTRVAEGGFTYSHNIISIYHPKWWFFGEDQKCSWGPKMKNKPNFFLITGVSQTGGRGGSATWEFFPHNPVFFPDHDPYTSYSVRILSWVTRDSGCNHHLILHVILACFECWRFIQDDCTIQRILGTIYVRA